MQRLEPRTSLHLLRKNESESGETNDHAPLYFLPPCLPACLPAFSACLPSLPPPAFPFLIAFPSPRLPSSCRPSHCPRTHPSPCRWGLAFRERSSVHRWGRRPTGCRGRSLLATRPPIRQCQVASFLRCVASFVKMSFAAAPYERRTAYESLPRPGVVPSRRSSGR
jgi:hypothetical protein